MTEEQGDQIIELLTEMLVQLKRIESNTDTPTVNDLDHVCSKLDDIKTGVGEVVTAIESGY